MKNLRVLVYSFILVLLISKEAEGQKSSGQTITRCYTMQRVQERLNSNPLLRRNTEFNSRSSINRSTVSNFRLNSVITIPVVVHIVLPNPYLVSDADVATQLAILNDLFSGFNADSTNVPSQFAALRGHSQIRFCLAKRTPAGTLTTGIDRRVSSTGSDADATQDPIKYTSLGGLDAWDPNQYLNYWVGRDGTGNGILGYSQFPSSTNDPITSDGVFINYEAWGTNSCYVNTPYNKGRTTVHETGHYLGLLHTWGDDAGCAGDDFADLTTAGSSCSLPTGLYNPSGKGNTSSDVGDTPNQGDQSSSCPGTLIKIDSCSKTAPGVMYQNLMDYTNDACLTMFTKKQVERMEWVVSNCRATLLTSMGCSLPVGAPALDAAPINSVNPGGFESLSCTSIQYYPSSLICPGNIIPKFRIVNNGLTTLTSLTVGYTLNNGTAVTQVKSVNLPFGATSVVSFPSVAVGTGINTFKFFTSNPNGSADQVPSNDTLSQVLTVSGTANLPITENFDNPEFPPNGWNVDNIQGDFTWQRKSPGKNGSPGELFVDNYNIDGTDNNDDFISPRLITTGVDSVIISFDLAHKYYPDQDYYDTLSVLISSDCGVTFKTVYQKYGPTLATAGSSSSDYTDPADSDWRTEIIKVAGPDLSSGKLSVIFRNSSRYGNNIHIDNINIIGKAKAPSLRDITVTSILAPSPINCSTSVTPKVVVSNVGVDAITSFSVGVSVAGGTPLFQTFTQLLDPGQSTTVSLAGITLPVGNYNIIVYSKDPVSAYGTGDARLANDTLSSTFSILGSQSAPLIEGFENSTSPPLNWGINNPDGKITWQRYNVGSSSSWSMYMNNFNYTAKQVDDLITPVISYSNVDSLQLSFDVAAGNKITGIPDTLTVLVTTDCGNSYGMVYQKWGNLLATTTSSQTTEFIPTTSAQWRKEIVDLSGFSKQSPVVLVFRVSNNNNNNIFIDNINFSSKAAPPLLTRRGYVILPTAFRNSFTIWYNQDPISLKYVNVFNTLGQLIYSKQFNNSSNRMIVVDLQEKAAGSYLVRLEYEDPSKNTSQWVIKY